MKIKEIERAHIINLFKLLALIIIASELKVLELLVNERTLYEEIYIMPQIPLICEYLFVSLIIFCGGFLVWCVLDRNFSDKE